MERSAYVINHPDSPTLFWTGGQWGSFAMARLFSKRPISTVNESCRGKGIIKVVWITFNRTQ